jgi:hypothetical protein
LVEVLLYKPEAAGSISDGVIDVIFPATLWHCGDFAFNRSEYHKYFLGVKAAGA